MGRTFPDSRWGVIAQLLGALNLVPELMQDMPSLHSVSTLHTSFIILQFLQEPFSTAENLNVGINFASSYL